MITKNTRHNLVFWKEQNNLEQTPAPALEAADGGVLEALENGRRISGESHLSGAAAAAAEIVSGENCPFAPIADRTSDHLCSTQTAKF